jgi:hypothetical protein
VVRCPTCGKTFAAPAAVEEVASEPIPVEPVRLRYRHGVVGFRCPYCQTDEPPMLRRRISIGGWIVFAALLIFCFPLFWIGLLIKEDYRVCRYCKIKLD